MVIEYSLKGRVMDNYQFISTEFRREYSFPLEYKHFLDFFEYSLL